MSTPSALPCGHSGCQNAPVTQWQQLAAATGTATVAVYACTAHTISISLAGMIHQPTCQGPNSPALPLCTCTPQAVATAPAPTDPALPASW